MGLAPPPALSWRRCEVDDAPAQRAAIAACNADGPLDPDRSHPRTAWQAALASAPSAPPGWAVGRCRDSTTGTWSAAIVRRCGGVGS